jgi:hypothetical protein
MVALWYCILSWGYVDVKIMSSEGMWMMDPKFLLWLGLCDQFTVFLWRQYVAVFMLKATRQLRLMGVKTPIIALRQCLAVRSRASLKLELMTSRLRYDTLIHHSHNEIRLIYLCAVLNGVYLITKASFHIHSQLFFCIAHQKLVY